MSPAAIRAATLVQIGKETTRGTGVAATRRLVGQSFTWRRMQELEAFEGENIGLLARTARAPLVVAEGLEFEAEMRLGFEQILWPLLSGVKGAVTPTTPGTGEARLWTFTPPVSADPLPDSYTAELEESSFTDVAEMESTYVLTDRLEARSEGGVPVLRTSHFGRKVSDSTKTASIALPTLTHASSARWAVYFDATWAGLGTTQITAQIRNLTYILATGIRPARYLDNRSDLDFSQYEFGTRQADLTFEVVHDPAAAKLVQTEEPLKTAGTLRFVRAQLNGAAFLTPDTALSRFIRLDGAYYHAADSMVERGQDADGNLITSVHLISAYDPTQAQDIQIAVQNNLTAFP